MKKPEELIEVEKLEKQGKLKQAVQEWQDKENKLSLLEDQYFSELRKMRESGKLGEQYRNLSDKRADIGSKRRLYAEKLHWARMTPEERESEVKFSEMWRKREERIKKEIQEVESRLTPEQIELRKKVIRFNDYCFTHKAVHASTENEAEKMQKEINEKATNMLKEILKEAKDIKEIEPLLRKKGDEFSMSEWEEFSWSYRKYKKLGGPILFFVAIRPGPPSAGAV